MTNKNENEESIKYIHEDLPKLLTEMEAIETPLESGFWKYCINKNLYGCVDFRKDKGGNPKGRRMLLRTGINGVADKWITDTADLDRQPFLKEFKEKRDELVTIKLLTLDANQKTPNKKMIEPNHRMDTTAPTKIVPTAAARELTRGGSGFLTAATTIDEAIEAFELYEQAKTKILKGSDILYIGEGGLPTTKEKGKPYIKKSGWRKLGRFFGLSTEVMQKEKTWTEDAAGKKYYIWTYQIKVSHSCGAFVISEGVCTSHDKFFTKGGRKEADENNVMLKAQTVGINRGISDLLGSGDVSAEEMGGSA